MNDTEKENSITIGIVIIGRNEGQRLIDCLNSINQQKLSSCCLVYVDSGSDDDSVQQAKLKGADIINLDMTRPFSAARARNEGWKYLANRFDSIEYIQFIDGDCCIEPLWLKKGIKFLENNPSYAVACGRRREKFPSESIYNRLCDDEWNTPVGVAGECGGDALIRLTSLQLVGGYKDYFVAGEEPEMCYRLRLKGLKIMRLDEDMTLHDAAIYSFSQWWQRSKRAGFAFCLMALEHKGGESGYFYKRCLSAFFWASISVLSLCFSIFNIQFLFLMALPIIQIMRISIKNNDDPVFSVKKATLIVILKIAEFQGIASCIMKKLSEKSYEIIEYK